MGTSRSFEPDAVDWRLLRELQADARLSFNELARRVHLSAPAVAERVRRLQEAGVIAGYHAAVDPAAVGQAVRAFVQLRCRPGSCLLRTTSDADYPEVAAVHRLSGEYCTLLEVRARDLAHFEGVVEQIGTLGELRTHVVLSTQYEGRPVAPLPAVRPVTPSAGWSGRGGGE
ncbi:Lrp/AsnC family transcriptional regulator [Dactylosporangium sp. NPDC051541]|uniref:Lrp/AsnC family transcriptional regulator n=1 Tax=Dactylosporangium sp. NPDC051541 TaxID=3363977 RepID=UPI0037A3660A